MTLYLTPYISLRVSSSFPYLIFSRRSGCDELLGVTCQATESNQILFSSETFPSIFLSSQLLPHHFLTSPTFIPAMTAMAHAVMPSALTFELIARCSVRPPSNILGRITLIITDYQSSSCEPHTPPWTCTVTSIHASRNSGVAERLDTTTIRSHRLPTLSEQHVPSRPKARTRSIREGWRSA